MNEHEKELLRIDIQRAVEDRVKAELAAMRQPPRPEIDDAEILKLMRPELDKGDGGYICDMAPERVVAAARSVLAISQRSLASDALRYRWLRTGDNDEYVMRFTNGKPVPVMDPDETAPCYLLRNEKLDAAIDEAMANEPRYELTDKGREMLKGVE